MKKLVSALLAALMLLSHAACGGDANAPGNSGSQGGEGKNTQLPTIDQIKLGEDYQDITATVKILTNRTDIVDTKYKEYAETFKQMYPNITVQYIQKTVADSRPGGEWFWRVDEDGLPDREKPVVEPWKCPYHNGRMCLEILRRNWDVSC